MGCFQGHEAADIDPLDGSCSACEYAAEMAAEGGWLRAAEYDAEAQDHMAYEDAMAYY